MAGFNYTKSRATAARLMKKFGQTGAIRRTTMTGGDPWNPTPETNDYPCKLVVTEYSLKERESSLVEQNDRKALISTEGVSIPALPDNPASVDAPTVADRLVIGGNVLSIIHVEPLNPGGTVVMWTAQARL